MNNKIDLKLIAALVSVAVIWGTTYLAIRIAVQTVPPWFVVAMRQLLATLILLSYLLFKKELKWIGLAHFKRQFILGVLMFVIANGLTTVAEKTIPSGLTSLLAGLSPIIVFLGSLLIGIQKPSVKGFFGVLLGFMGVAFIFRTGFSELLHPNYLQGVFTLLVAITGWSVGTIYSKIHVYKSSNLFLDLFYQFACAAIIQLALALLLETPQIATWSYTSLIAIVYLGIFGSVVGYFSYVYALKKVSAVEVSILSYFNTIIALFLGTLILNEPFTFDLLIATFLIIIGVFIINYKKETKTLKTS